MEGINLQVFSLAGNNYLMQPKQTVSTKGISVKLSGRNDEPKSIEIKTENYELVPELIHKQFELQKQMYEAHHTDIELD